MSVAADSRPETPAGGELCLHEVFERQVARRGHAVALECGSRRYTYLELDVATGRLARMLRNCGAGPGRFVMLFCERSELPITAILACNKAGVAYVPIDPAYPLERIAGIADELSPVLCLTEPGLAGRAGEAAPGVPRIDLAHRLDYLLADLPDRSVDRVAGSGRLAGTLAADAEPLDRIEPQVSPEDLAYVIYTSGSTGRPKGVMTEHRHVTRFVEAFNEVCRTGPADRVHQGFSLSFDGSVEEIWMAWSNGSTLVVPDREAPRFGDGLAAYLRERRITYFSTVPTMLSTIGEEIPSLRTIVLSGEVCPAELVDRWARPGVRLFNVYGPTEATVNTTVARCRAGSPVTIGRPLRGYDVHIVSADLTPTEPGQPGELVISGPTLARGYLGQPELTSATFPETSALGAPGRLYRTGDLARWNDQGELEFLGRLDSQVKIRGYRVELSEIESVLAEHDQIGAAAVRVAEVDGLQQLAAYAVLRDGAGQLDRDDVLRALHRRLPQYMVPRYLDQVDALPRTISGKIDRNRLPSPERALVDSGGSAIEPRTALERQIAGVWTEVLGVDRVAVDDDFFQCLGGHSLLAGRMVTQLRQRIPVPVTLRDAYRHPTVRTLAEALEARSLAEALETRCSAEASADESLAEPGQSGRAASAGPELEAGGALGQTLRAPRRMIVLLQALSTYLVAAVALVVPMAVLIAAELAVRGRVGGWTGVMIMAVVVGLGAWPAMLGISVATKWLLIGRYRAGDYPLWGSFYFRWWLCQRIQALSGAGMLAGTPLLPVYFRLMGAKVGARCTLDTAQVSTWDLIDIGSDTSIGADTQLLGYRVEDGMLRLGTVTIGDGCFVGLHSALGLNVTMGDGSSLDDQSLLADGQVAEAGSGRRGSPSQPAEVLLPAPGPPVGRWQRALFGLAHLVILLVDAVLLLPIAAAAVGLPVVAFLQLGPVALAAATLVSVPVSVVVSCLAVAGLRRLVLPRLLPGNYPVHSLIYLRKWWSDGLVRGSRAALLPVYTTLYLPGWLRLMGARIGPRAELSTVWSFAPESVEVGPESFFADGSIVGGRRTNGGMCQVAGNRIGRRSFVGNSAVLPVGVGLGDRCLLGVQSVPPAGEPQAADGTEWLGSPAFALTNRPKVGDFGTSVTFRPTRKLYAQRAGIDALRILIPGYLALAGMVLWILPVYSLLEYSLPVAVAVAPALGLVLGIAEVLAVAGLKRLVMHRYRPTVQPLWSRYVWLNEMVNGAYESVAAPVLNQLLGTPMVAVLLRRFGCRIGRNTFIATTLFSEWDLVDIGDCAALNPGAVIQNHLFEDRIFKSSTLTIGQGATVGNMAVVLYDAELQTGAHLGPLSLLMKGESLGPGSRWHGIPTVPA